VTLPEKGTLGKTINGAAASFALTGTSRNSLTLLLHGVRSTVYGVVLNCAGADGAYASNYPVASRGQLLQRSG
jgi:hypothetical protein